MIKSSILLQPESQSTTTTTTMAPQILSSGVTDKLCTKRNVDERNRRKTLSCQSPRPTFFEGLKAEPTTKSATWTLAANSARQRRFSMSSIPSRSSAPKRKKREDELLEDDPEYVAALNELDLPEIPPLESLEYDEYEWRETFIRTRRKACKELAKNILLKRELSTYQACMGQLQQMKDHISRMEQRRYLLECEIAASVSHQDGKKGSQCCISDDIANGVDNSDMTFDWIADHVVDITENHVPLANHASEKVTGYDDLFFDGHSMDIDKLASKLMM